MEWDKLKLTFSRSQANIYIDMLENEINRTKSNIDSLKGQLRDCEETMEELVGMINSAFDEWLKVRFESRVIWLVTRGQDEFLYTLKPVKDIYGDWVAEPTTYTQWYKLPNGYIERLIGKKMEKFEEPLEYKVSNTANDINNNSDSSEVPELENVVFFEEGANDSKKD